MAEIYFDVLVEVVLLVVLLVLFLCFFGFFVLVVLVVEVVWLVFCLATGAAIRKGTATAANTVDLTNFFIEFISFLIVADCWIQTLRRSNSYFLGWLLVLASARLLVRIAAHNFTLTDYAIWRHHLKEHS